MWFASVSGRSATELSVNVSKVAASTMAVISSPALSEWQQRDTADATRMQELQQVRESVELQAAEASTLTVVQPPIPRNPSSQQWVIVVASLHGMAAAESQPAVSAATASGQHSAQTSADPPTTRVVASGAVGDSTLTPEIIGAATDVVLVARIEVDIVAQALVLRSAAASSPAPGVAAFTYSPSRTARFRKRQPREQPSAPSPPAGVVGEERSAA
jgi:hypothetical protein